MGFGCTFDSLAEDINSLFWLRAYIRTSFESICNSSCSTRYWPVCVLMNRRSQSVQNLYSTVNGLLASADRLSQQVAQQMEALNISAQPQISQRIMNSVGLSSEDTLHMQSRPSFNGASSRPLARQQSINSPALKAELGLPIHSTPPRRTMPSDSGVGAPSVTRRRRDSMDGVSYFSNFRLSLAFAWATVDNEHVTSTRSQPLMALFFDLYCAFPSLPHAQISDQQHVMDARLWTIICWSQGGSIFLLYVFFKCAL